MVVPLIQKLGYLKAVNRQNPAIVSNMMEPPHEGNFKPPPQKLGATGIHVGRPSGVRVPIRLDS